MSTDPRKNFGANSPKMSASELAKKLGVELAVSAPVTTAMIAADPFHVVETLRRAHWLKNAAIEGVCSPRPGGGCHYRLELAAAPVDAAKPAFAPREWMRAEMADTAAAMDWLRTWVPKDLLPDAFKNLWAGRGYMVDEAAGLAMGTPPPAAWLATSAKNAQGIMHVRRRAG